MMRIDEEKVRWSLEEAQILFHFDLNNSTFQEQVALICNTFQAYEFKILKGQQVWS
jgi:antitoxin component HigA of HigAB toxin-antitoxin module